MDKKILKTYTDYHGNVIIWNRDGEHRIRNSISFIPYYWTLENNEYKKMNYSWENRFNINFKNTYEGDLAPHKLYLINNEPDFEENYKLLYFDIETKDTQGGVEIGRDRIISICCVDNSGKEFIFCEDSEIDLLIKFKNTLLKYDVIIGWNSDKFDLPYLKARLEINNIYFNFNDINHIDLMRVFMKSYIVQRKLGEVFVKSYSLSNMSKIFLHDDKLKDDSGEGYGGRLWKLFNKDRDTLIKYNLQDSVLLRRLDEELNLINNLIELSNITKVNLEDTVYQSRMIDMYTLRRAKKQNIHFPTIARGVEKAEYEGGLCELSKAGFYKNVVIFDFKSLYPSLIRTFNISPDTLLDDDSTEEHYLTFNNIKFKKTRGIVPTIIDELIEYRFKLRDEQKKHDKTSKEYLKCEIKQIAVKILALSYYGVLGSAFSRYFSLRLAKSITLNGQNLLKKIIEFIGTKDYCKWIYSDTDSCFISFIDLSYVTTFKKEVDEFINLIVKTQTGENNKFLEFQQERMFDKFIILSKKKYVGRVIGEDKLYDDKTKIYTYNKGLELVKGDQIILAKELLEKTIKYLLESDNNINQILLLIKEYKTKILTGAVTVNEITCCLKVSKMIDEYKNPPPHVKMAFDRKKLGERFYVNMRVNFIILNTAPLQIIHPSEFTGKFDKLHYWDTKIFNPTQRLLEIVYPMYNWERIGNISLELCGQKTLDDIDSMQKVLPGCL